jgi:hypothetical protein
MDAPPEQEDCRPFLHVAALFREAGVHVPEVLRAGSDQGFLLLSDLGNTTYLNVLTTTTPRRALPRRQRRAGGHPARQPPRRAARVRPRAAAARAQALPRLVRRPPPRRHPHEKQDRDAARVFEKHPRQQPGQPQVFVHRDYHSRNLMVLDGRLPGQPRHHRLPGRRLRPDHLRPRLALQGRLHHTGTRTSNSTVIRYWEMARASRPAGARRLRRLLPRLRVDGRAAPDQGARHLRPPLPPRRQGRLPEGHAAVMATCAGLRALRRTGPLLRLLDQLENRPVRSRATF